jgi:signal transduction histidine kinase
MAFPQRDDLPLWLANAIPYLALVLILPARLSDLWHGVTPDLRPLGVAAVAALIASTAPVMAARVPRHMVGWLLAGQAALNFAPYLWIGVAWGTVGGLLTFSIVMLLRPGRAKWSLAVLALVADVVARGVVHGSVPDGLAALGVDGNVVVMLYGLTRMRDLILREHAVREELARLAAAEKSLRAARDLREGLGAELSSIVRLSSAATGRTEEIVDAARRALSGARRVAAGSRSYSPAEELEAARAVLSAAGVEVSILGTSATGDLAPVLRPVVLALLSGQVVSCTIDVDDSALLRVSWRGNADLREVPGLRIGPGQVAEVRVPVSPQREMPLAEVPRRFAVRMLTLSVPCYVLLAFVNAWSSGSAPSAIWFTGLVGALLGALSLYLVAPRADDAAPAAWRWVLGLQLAVVAAVFSFHPQIGSALAPLHLVAGAVLIRSGVLWSVPIVVVLVVGTSGGMFSSLYLAMSIVFTMLSLYTFNRLPTLSRRLHESRQELAKLAVLKEQLRVSRDVHDLLGFHLSAIVLKSELAAALPSDRAAEQLADVASIAKRALADFRSITGEPAELSLADEVAAARSLLAAAGVEVHADVAVPVPPEADVLLAIVLREAVTNVVRHATASRCEIEVTGVGRTVALRVCNDGAHAIGEGGSGLSNMSVRVEEAEGVLKFDLARGHFTLTVVL